MPRSPFVPRRLRATALPRVLAQCVAVLAAAFFSTSLAAQTVSLDNVTPIALTASASLSAVTIDPSTGNVIVRSSAGNLTQCTGIPTGPSIGSFTASAGTVVQGSNFSLSWSSTNTTSCSPSQGSGTQWSSLGTLGTSGSQQLTAPQTAGTITFQLTCTNGASSVSSTTQVTVQPVENPNCTAPGAGDLGEFNGTFGIAWPAYNDKIRQFIVNGHYLSLHFTATASPTQFGTINTTGFPGDGDGNGVVSISPTPGCFNAALLGERCVSPLSTYPGVSWTNGQSAFACRLTPGGSYNVNLYFPDCPSGTCGRDFGNIQQLLIQPESSR